MKIVVIDDNLLVLKKVSHFLRKNGHDVVESSNAMEGLSLILKHQPDVVVTDLLMPYVTGDELYKTLNFTHKVSPRMIFITSLKDKYIRELNENINKEDIIPKPINLSVLNNKINQIAC